MIITIENKTAVSLSTVCADSAPLKDLSFDNLITGSKLSLEQFLTMITNSLPLRFKIPKTSISPVAPRALLPRTRFAPK